MSNKFLEKNKLDPTDKGGILSNLSRRFNAKIAEQVEFIESIIGTNEDIKTAKDLISLIVSECEPEILQRSTPKIWEYRNYIVKKDEKFFLETKDYEKFIVQGSSYANFQHKIAAQIKTQFPKLSTSDKNKMWVINNHLLQIVIQYRRFLEGKEIPESDCD